MKRAAELLLLLEEDLLFSNTILCVRRAELRRRTAGAKEDVIGRLSYPQSLLGVKKN